MEPLNNLEKELLQKWLRKADGDLRAARRLADAPEDFETAAFHCQQAVEKYLKARLAAAGQAPPRTHDLTRLLTVLAPVEQFTAQEEKWARELTPLQQCCHAGRLRRWSTVSWQINKPA
jgi:HEPN domain-containing protein